MAFPSAMGKNLIGSYNEIWQELGSPDLNPLNGDQYTVEISEKFADMSDSLNTESDSWGSSDSKKSSGDSWGSSSVDSWGSNDNSGWGADEAKPAAVGMLLRVSIRKAWCEV